MNCKYCRANCTGAKQDREIALCLGYDPPKTNGDFIRAMTDEELCDEYFRIYHNVLPRYTDSRIGLLGWLKQEATDDRF